MTDDLDEASPVKVLQVHAKYRQTGGEDNVVAAEAELLREAGHEVVQMVGENDTNPVKAAVQVAGSAWNLRQQLLAKRTAERERPDVAHIHNTWFALSPAAIHGIHSAGVPVVMTLHNYRLTCANALLIRDGAPCTLCVTGSAWNGVRYRCYRDSVPLSLVASGRMGVHRTLGTWSKIVDLFLPLSHFAESLFTEAGLPASKMLVKPNFTADPGPRSIDPAQSDYLLFVGRLSPEKGVDVLLDAWRRAALPGFRLRIVGDGPSRRELENAHAGAPNVDFVGRVDKARVRQLMLSARTLVVPSVWFEGAPLTILESFASGLPVIASRLGAMEELVERLGNEWMAPHGDPEALARVLHGVADDAVVSTAGRRARALYDARYNPRTALAGLESAYARAIQAHTTHG